LKTEGKIDRVAIAVVMLVVVAAPWPFGSVRAGATVWYFPLVGAMLLVALARHWIRPDRIAPMHAAWFVAALGLVWGLAQSVPLPREIVEWISPTRAAFESALAGPVPGEVLASETIGASFVSLTIYPHFTRRACEMLGLALAIAWLVSQSVRSNRSAQVCIGCVLGTALAVALFGLAQKLNWNGLIYWRYAFPLTSEPFGPFVNRNHAAGYLNLGGAAAIYYLMSLIGTQGRAKSAALPASIGSLAAIGLFAACILVSGSRGGLIAWGAGLVVVAGVLAGRRSARGAIVTFAIPVAIAIGMTVWLGFGPGASTRFSTLGKWQTYARDGRVLNWQAGLATAIAYPLTGTGYGTYRYAFQPFEQRDATTWLQHPENCWVETLVEGGIPALMLALLGTLLAFMTFASGILRGDAHRARVCCAALFALVTQAVQNCMDWGIYLPSNLITGTVLISVGLVQPISGPAPTRRRIPLGTTIGMGILALAVVVSGTVDLWRFSRLEPALVAAQKYFEPGVYRDRPTLDQAIVDLEAGLAAGGRNAEAHLLMAKLRIARYERAVDGPESRVDPQSRAMLRLESLVARARAFESSGDIDRLAAIRHNATVRSDLTPARERLLAARARCAFIGDAHLQLARLAFLEGAGAFEEHVERAVRCRPADPAILVPSSILYLTAGDTGSGINVLGRAWRLAPTIRAKLVAVLEPVVPIDRIAVDVVPFEPDALMEFVRRFVAGTDGDEANRSIAVRLRAKLAGQSVSERDARLWKGVCQYLEGKRDQAVIEWERAITEHAAPARWRAELAEVYVEIGNSERARFHYAMIEPRAVDPNDDAMLDLIESVARKLAR